jgi:hypothetical protein
MEKTNQQKSWITVLWTIYFGACIQKVQSVPDESGFGT